MIASQKSSKIPLKPLLSVTNRLVTDFLAKANLFNDFFSKQCSAIGNNSFLATNLTFETKNRISTFDFSTGDIIKFIKALNPNKAHGDNGISIRMIKLCPSSISKPLHIVFKNCLENERFPDEWKKTIIVPAYKIGDKQLINNYRPILLLPICAKVFEKIIFNRLFKFLDANKLLNKKQSGFRPDDSCAHQLLSIIHEIYKAFDANPSLEVRGFFLEIYKAFNRVWHEGLVYKLKCFGVCGKYYGLIQSFLTDSFQRVVLHGQSSNWCHIKSGVPQGSILLPLFFFKYLLMIFLKD